VSFPGGLRESDDADLTETAVRELGEETGIDSSKVDVWGLARALRTSGGRWVTPVVRSIDKISEEDLRKSVVEVESIFFVSLPVLADLSQRRYTQYRASPHAFTLAVFVGGEHKIWGMTATVTDVLLNAVLGTKMTSSVGSTR